MATPAAALNKVAKWFYWSNEAVKPRLVPSLAVSSFDAVATSNIHCNESSIPERLPTVTRI